MIIWFEPTQWNDLSRGQSLFRGFSRKMEGVSIHISSPENRLPLSMPLGIQIEMDNWFENLFGIRFRQRSIFATGSLETAKHYAGDYGEVRTLRPLAPFCFCWSEHCADLYEEYESMPREESIQQLIQRLEFKCVGLERALQSSHEILLVGNAFQAVLKE